MNLPWTHTEIELLVFFLIQLHCLITSHTINSSFLISNMKFIFKLLRWSPKCFCFKVDLCDSDSNQAHILHLWLCFRKVTREGWSLKGSTVLAWERPSCIVLVKNGCEIQRAGWAGIISCVSRWERTGSEPRKDQPWEVAGTELLGNLLRDGGEVPVA